MKKRDWINILILIAVGLLLMFFIKGENNIYGSEADWLSQHWALPEYFRMLFYETGNLFPNLGPNLGGGQNIYYFSYYGLLNPIILLSYLFPFVEMIDYIIISSIMTVIISTILFYIWIRNKGFDSKFSFISAFIFMLANPLIFHSHRHIMFINYMPFVILGLMGIDSYVKNNKKWLLILSVFFIIMTSYFYSVSSLVVLAIYAIYKIYGENLKLKESCLKLFKIISLMFVGIIMSGVLLLPTIAVIFGSRSQGLSDLNFLSLLIPKINVDVFLYTPYSLGMTMISIASLVYGYFSKNKRITLLSIMLSIIFFIPLIVYLLNGMLYVRYKVLIPFLPLVCLLITNFIDAVIKKEVKLLVVFIVTLIIAIINFNFNSKTFIYFMDLLILFGVIYIYYRTNKEKVFLITILLLAFFNSLISSFDEKFVSVERYNNEFNDIKSELIIDTIENDKSFYRFNNLDATLSTANKIYHPMYFQTSLYSSTYNQNYNDFYYSTFKNAIPYRNRVITAQSNNVLFQMLMGVKYIGTSEEVPIGYSLIKKADDFAIYRNDNVFPLGYATDKIMNIDDFEKLDYPYNLEPLLIGSVANQKSNYEYQSKIEEVKLDYEVEVGSNIDIKTIQEGYKINVLKNDSIIMDINNLKKGQILIVEFELLNNPSCSEGDIRIAINGIRNVLTCKEWLYHNRNYTFEYVISSNDVIKNLNIDFVKGTYEIANIHTYILDYDYVKEFSKKNDQMEVDMTKTKGDYIYGKINATNDGYFVTTIPYDKGFKVFLNENLVEIEEVNDGFLGFPINKGEYEVIIKYEAPLFKEGLILSCFGSILFLMIIIFDKKKKMV